MFKCITSVSTDFIRTCEWPIRSCFSVCFTPSNGFWCFSRQSSLHGV